MSATEALSDKNPHPTKIILKTQVSLLIGSFNYLVPSSLLIFFTKMAAGELSPDWSDFQVAVLALLPPPTLPFPKFLDVQPVQTSGSGRGGAGAGCDVHGSYECRPQGQVGKGPGNMVGPRR